MSAPWDAVAAPGTDPAELAHLVGLSQRHRGRALLRLPQARSAGPAAVAAGVGPAATLAPLVRAARERWREHSVPLAERTAADLAARQWEATGVHVALVGDPAYPTRLADGFPEGWPAPWLAWRGPATGVPVRPRVAIVGARRASSYGSAVAAWLAEAAGRAGASVVSGGAVGIDAAAHDAATATSGGTVVVLGCGHDVRYPRPHHGPGRLFARVLADGGVLLSEQLPEQHASPARVLARNRLVAGMADVVVVVEGGPRSGSLRTASDAAERGVRVLAVPGDVRAPGSAAPHRLLLEGAGPVTGPEDLLDALGVVGAGVAPDETASDATAALSTLPTALAHALRDAWPRPRRLDALVGATGLTTGVLLAAVTAGRVAGVLVEAPDGIRLTRAPR